MELDSFKALYQAHFDQLPQQSEEELTRLLHQRSATAIERVLQNLLREIGLGLANVLIITFYMLFWPSVVIRGLGLAGILLGLIQVGAFGIQYRQLNKRLTGPIGSVRQHLSDTIGLISRFMRLYYQYCLVSIPVSVAFGVYVGLSAETADPTLSGLFQQPTVVKVLLVLLLCGLIVVGTYWLLHWYIDRLYGRYLAKLKGCLQDLDEVAS